MEDNASPFNIAEHMEVPYFTKEQVYDLLSQHEKEIGQIFEEKVKELIWHNAGGQPGLTNALAYDLVMKKAKGEKIITEKHFEKTLYDFMHRYIDKNISNIISKAEKEKELIMKILFESESVEFNIYDERINYLYLNGVIDNCEGKCCVRVPLYYKALYDRFKPQVNGEKDKMKPFGETIKNYIDNNGILDLNKLMKRYIKYIKQRGAIMFKGRNYYEGVYQYNLDQFLSLYVEATNGKVYPETEVGGGRIDLLINLNNKEYLIEVKANIDSDEYEKGKKQLLEYLKRKEQKEGWLIIYSNAIEDFEYITEEKDGVKLHIWFIKTNFESPSKVK
ncbi:AAA-like domain-containing protein [Marinitoga lauensis]|uniref:AAA-like domain-containing protein n=1 Tax=Marinitoga lauensis TaxID=2201189 RepID=UPI001F0E140C|nr:AAA-like domain-containing protein [Marinitoga lauensis]